jgi:hypothetical protein
MEFPDLVLRQAQDEVLRGIASSVDLMVSLSNHEVVALEHP